jgi:N-terminal domain of galactosyltransferase/Glycosyl transferase family 2
MVKIPYHEIIIVDWSSKEDLLSLIKTYKDPRIVVVRVEDQLYFDRGGAWNVGIRQATGDFINCMDCDILACAGFSIKTLKPNHLYLEQLIDKTGDVTSGIWTKLYGTCIFSKNMWEVVNGYQENLETWGREDRDFYVRLVKAGFIVEQGWTSGLTHIEHDNSIRFVNHKLKFSTTGQSEMHNKKLLDAGQLTRVNNSYNTEVFDYTGALKTNEK